MNTYNKILEQQKIKKKNEWKLKYLQVEFARRRRITQQIPRIADKFEQHSIGI